MVFVNSMSDLFHKKVPKNYIDSVFEVMEEADRHVFQVLTKRSSLMRNYVRNRYGPDGNAPSHIWLGVSIETPIQMVRLRHLKETPAGIRFVSFEPLLDKIGKVDLSGIDWAIVGGESGPGARPIKAQWIRQLRDECNRQEVAFFFKQWGGRSPKANGNEIDGKHHLEFPFADPSIGLAPA